MSLSLYRFFSNTDYHLDSLCSSYLWFSRIENFNDPFEGLYTEQLFKHDPEDISDEQFIQIYKTLGQENGRSSETSEQELISAKLEGKFDGFKRYHLSNLVNSHLQKMKDFRDDYYHCCFSLDDCLPDTKVEHSDDELSWVITHKLMWSHYADGLRGYCIEFDAVKLANNIGDSAGRPFYYGILNYRGLSQTTLYEDIVENKRNKKFPSNKCKEWAYEREARFSVKKQVVEYDIDSINHVIIGEKMPASKRVTLFTVLQGLLGDDWRKVLKVARINKQTFNIDIDHFKPEDDPR